MTCGVLAGLLCYIRSASAGGKKRVAWLAAMVAAQTLGLFSKESGAVLPALLALYDLTLGKPGEWRRRVPAYAALLLPFAAFFYLRGAAHTHLRIPFFENPLVAAGFFAGRLTAIKVIGKLAGRFLWPVHLSADYSFNAVPIFGWRLDWEDAQALLALAVLLGAALLAVRWRRSHPAVCFFIGFFFVGIAPTANLVVLIGSIMAERFLYLGSIGLAGCAVAAVRALSLRVSHRQPRAAWAVWAASGLLCLLLAARTHARNRDWSDELSLWTSAVDVCPTAARPHNNLGNALAQSGDRLPEAIAEFRTALRILPGYADAHYNLGNALAQSNGGLPEAISEYRAALRVDPDYTRAHLNLGTALSQMPGHGPEAIVELQAAVRLEPDSAEARYDLGNLLAQSAGRAPDAISEYRAALRIDPDYAKAHNNLGSLLSQMPGRLGDAIAEYRAALRSDPDYAKAHNNLGNALVKTPGRLTEAIAEYQAALRSQPDFADAHYNLGIVLARMPDRRAEAIAELEAAMRIDPNPETGRALDWLRGK
jgi:tetratricopeptide (TPR) repeat protein